MIIPAPEKAYGPYVPLGVVSLFFRLVWIRLFPAQALKTLEHHVLIRNSGFYAGLSDRGKARFVRRVMAFHNLKYFVGMKGFQITAEVPVILAEAAVRISFCLDNSSFNHLQKIHVYPERFPVSSGRLSTGQIGKSKLILISWKDVINGTSNPMDGTNIAITLFAKSLEMEIRNGLYFDKWVADYFGEWLKVAEKTRIEMAEKYPVLEDAPVQRAHLEILGTAITRFLETPHWMKENIPEMYEKLCILLNQDPLNTLKTDYFYDRKLAAERRVKKVDLRKELNIQRNFGKRYFHWSFVTMFIFPVLFIVVYAYLVRLTWITPTQWLIIISSAGIAGGILFTRPLLRRENVPALYYVLFNILVAIPFLLSLLISLNFTIPVSSFEKSYRITKYTLVYENGDVSSTIMNYKKIKSIILELEENDLPPQFLRVSADLVGDIESANTAVFYFNRGVFGFPVLENVELLEADNSVKML